MPVVSWTAVRPAVVVAAALLAASCAGTAGEPAPPVAEPRGEPTVRAVLDNVELELEVADEPAERAHGLMGRTAVPPGTGMVFQFPEPASGPSFYMYRVPVPLTAVFVRDGVVVHVAQMDPCPSPDPAECPRYGPEGEFDTVVEAAPGTLAGVAVGDPFAYRS